MKKQMFTLIATTSLLFSYAQEEMPLVWEQKMEHKIEYNGTGTEERGYSYAASAKEITFFDNNTGQTKWTAAFKEIVPKLSKIDELIPFWESNILFLFDRKMGKDQMACVDMESGKLLWSTDKYQDVSDDNLVYIPEDDAFAISLKTMLVYIKARTGEEKWSTSKFKGVVGKYVYMSDGYMVAVNFVPGGLGALFTGFKNQIAKFNMSNGDIVWENTYIGRAERKIVSRDFIYDLDVENNKVFLRLNGIQVYDYNTGANLYSAAFDFTPDIIGKPINAKKFGVYGAVADPVVIDQDLYVLDMMNKRTQYIKKYDLNSGKLLWTSPEIKEAKAIPHMMVEGDKIILQIGGAVECQAVIKKEYTVNNVTYYYWVYKIYYKNVKPCGVQAFNTKDGSLAWDSERFRKGITNGIMIDNQYYICSGTALYKMDANTGNEMYEVPISNAGVGNATLIFPYQNKIAMFGEKGVAIYNTEKGELMCSGKYKTSDVADMFDNIVIMETDNDDIAAFDLNTCKYLQFNAKKGAISDLSTDGQYVYVYENKVVSKLKTK
ncbi:MAG: PQQ-binding-like beta-propeller repeat protein [Bacteroidetes bacterium]|nr:PQQ-binding-like beta-propeller repeat protein [Bacteroidota bacterium]